MILALNVAVVLKILVAVPVVTLGAVVVWARIDVGKSRANANKTRIGNSLCFVTGLLHVLSLILYDSRYTPCD